MKRTIIFLYFFLLAFSCSSPSQKAPADQGRLYLNVYAAENIPLYLISVPFHGEKRRVIDSAVVRNVHDTIRFNFSRVPERMYEIEVRNSYKTFSFIGDSSDIYIRANNITGDYSIAGSPASASLKEFTLRQRRLSTSARHIYDSLEIQGKSSKGRNFASLKKRLSDSLQELKQRNINYADTVHDAVAFLAVYDRIDFGQDYEKMKEFVLAAGRRFPSSAPVTNLVRETLQIVDIYEHELEVGDSMPPIMLPDIMGNEFSTATLKGKYYLLNVWSTWCDRCMPYIPVEKDLNLRFPRDKFAVVSVALDNNPVNWRNFITREGDNWTQLIDTGMWLGNAAKTLKFDSIPFNFLVSPAGRILAKGVRADSLLAVIHQHLR